MDVLLLHNERAGDEAHSRKNLVALLKRHGHRVTYSTVNEGLADSKRIKSCDLIVVAGGDGTVRTVVTHEAARLQPVAILPLGTANNIAHSLRLGTELPEIIASWKNTSPRPLDLGVAKGPWGRTTFVEGIGFGLIGRTISILDALDAGCAHEFPSPADKLHRDKCVLAALTHEMPPIKARVTLPDERIKDDFLLLELLNISRAGPGLVLARGADPGDGCFNLVSITVDERRKLIRELQRHAGGKRGARFHEVTTRKLSLELEACELRIDDSIVLTAADFRRFPRAIARIEVKLEAGAVQLLAPS